MPLQPEEAYLDVLGEVLRRDVDLYEVAPETTWRADGRGELHDNGFHRVFSALGDETGKPFVAHGVGLSMATSSLEPARRRQWLARLDRDQRRFRYRWYTDHLGATSLAGCAVGLPVSVPLTSTTARRVRATLRAMASVVPRVGFETTAQYFWLGSPLDEPFFIRDVLTSPRFHLLLDLHNVHTMAHNAGFDPLAYVRALPLERVIEIHLSGGRPSDPRWHPDRRSLWLDSHDTAVPDEVWRLYEAVIAWCPNLRAVIVERMEGTVGSADVPVVQAEIARARRVAERRSLCAPPAPHARAPRRRNPRALEATAAEHRRFERAMLEVLLDPDPPAAAHRAARDRRVPRPFRRHLGAVDADGLRLAALLVAKLRFERLLNGHAEADAWFDRDPRAFTDAFGRYHRAAPPTAFFPPAEGDLFDRWLAVNGRADAPTRTAPSR